MTGVRMRHPRGRGRRLTLALLIAAPAAAGTSAPRDAGASLRPYEESSAILATTPGNDDGALGALFNPAQWGVLDRPELSFFWSDANVRPERLDNWGFAAGHGLGFSARRVETAMPGGPRRVTDYQIGIGFGSGGRYGGVAFAFSGASKGAFDRSSSVTWGSIRRPTRWLSLGSTLEKALGDPDIGGVMDVGIRPLSDPRVLLVADYALRRGDRWDDGALRGGVALRPVPGLFAAARWERNDRIALTLGLGIGRASFRASPRYDDGARGTTHYAFRSGAPERGFDLDGRLSRGRRTMGLHLDGRIAYQSHRWLDDGSIPLRRVTDRLRFAAEDPTVGGVAVSLSGFEGNLAMAWEVREELLDVKRAGKRVTVVCDNLDAATLYLASSADHVVMDPRGMMVMPGVQVSRTYLKNLLGKIGLGFDEWRFYKYKSALETFSRDRMSDADREQLGALTQAVYAELKRGLVSSGRATPEEFDRVVNEEPLLFAPRLVELGWVDATGRWEDLENGDPGAHGAEPRSYESIARRRWMPDEEWGRVPTIALVYLVGPCAMDEGIRARSSSRALRAFREDRSVDAVVLRVDSPGGDPLASDVVAGETRKLREAKKPVLVSQGRVAGSGGYWISMDGETIVTSPFTVTGSIGVTGGWAWNDGFGRKTGLTSDHVRQGSSADLMGGIRIPLAGVTLPERNLNARERRLIERRFEELYDDFTARVAAARGLDVPRVRELGEGRIYDGRAAVELKLADRVGTLDDTIEEAKRRAGIPSRRRVRIVEHPRRPLLRLPWFLGSASASAAASGDPLALEARVIQSILERPGEPLLLTPGSLLPRETEPSR